MTPSARLSAAIDIFSLLLSRPQPVAHLLKDWGVSHRFAGSKDRTFIAHLIYDALRVRSSSAFIMGEETPRAIILGSMRRMGRSSVEEISALCSGERFAPAPLSLREKECLKAASLEGAPDHVQGDYPSFMSTSFASAFGENAVKEGEALAQRAPVDLRVNTLLRERDALLHTLAYLSPHPTPFSPLGIRLGLDAAGRGPVLSAEPAYVKGWVEVQDEASQLAALLSGAKPSHKVLDLCAGAGGKTLALAAMMQNRGQIYASDVDGRRLMPLYDRLQRAQVRNVQIRAPRRDMTVALQDLEGACDLVVVDAPCTGMGTWRRHPDTKWRTRKGALEERQKDQRRVLQQAVQYVKEGGRLVYITCSLLREENEDPITDFLAEHNHFLPLDVAHLCRLSDIPHLAPYASPFGPGLRLSPFSSLTDGFYIVVLRAGA